MLHLKIFSENVKNFEFKDNDDIVVETSILIRNPSGLELFKIRSDIFRRNLRRTPMMMGQKKPGYIVDH